MSARGVSPAAVGRALGAYLADAGIVLRLHDRATGETFDVPAEVAGDPAGLLPVFLVAGEAVWREATGHGFALRIRRDPDALLGYRAEGIGAGTFCAVALSAMEAAFQAAGDRGDVLAVNALIESSWRPVPGGPGAGSPAWTDPASPPVAPAASSGSAPPAAAGACP